MMTGDDDDEDVGPFPITKTKGLHRVKATGASKCRNTI
jgi:hypothetical protein